MSRFDESFSRQFREWETRGRGGRLFEQPIALEPPFVPFLGYRSPPQEVDDGKHDTMWSRFWNRLTAPQENPKPEEPIIKEPELVLRHASESAELQLTLPAAKPFSSANYQSFLRQVLRTGEPFAFEILGTATEIVPQFAGFPVTVERIARALPQFMPGIETLPSEDSVRTAWSETNGFIAIEVALGAEFALPLSTQRTDILASVVNAMEQLSEDETALYQVLIEPAVHNWPESLVSTVSDSSGKPIFKNRPELVSGAERKISSPLLAVIVRFAVTAEDGRHRWRIIRDMMVPFGALAAREGNFLIPLSNEGYDPAAHEADILDRTSHRTGMLLNVEELIPFIDLPTASVSPRLRRQTARTRAAPEELQCPGSLLLGTNRHAGRESSVSLTDSHRTRHAHLLGASGTGKSTLIFNLLRQDIEQGAGLALLDPHGDLVEKVLAIVPPDRRGDVVLVDPSDEEHIVGFNILAAHSDFERNLLASDLVSTFRRLSTSWGEQMNSVLRNAILAFLESSCGGTLADMRRFLLDAAYRKEFLRTVSDPDVSFYWERAFPQLTGNKSIGPVLTRLDEFLSRKPIRYMVSQKENRLDFADILDRSRILLVKLPQGQIGRENANLLGSVIVSKIQQMAMSRQRMRESERRNFWVYLDEFPSFITPSMAEILTGARKYRVGLILAHQELHQLEADRDVASAVLANCCTRIVFRVSDRDARELANGFTHFEPNDLQNLGVGQAICRVERSEADFNLTVSEPEPMDEEVAELRAAETRRISNLRYAKHRDEVEAELSEQMQREADAPERKSQPKETPPEEATPAPAPPLASVPSEPVPLSAVPETSPVSPEQVTAPPEVGRGRGGEDHQLIVANLASEASRFGFRNVKECVVDGGRIDLVIQTSRVRVAVEVAVNSNTAHEIENLTKCVESKMDVIVSVSPNENARANIEKTAHRTFDAETFAKMRFEAPEFFVKWMREVAEREPPAISPDAPKTRTVAGRKVKVRHVEMSPEERRKQEAEELDVIADLLRNKDSKKSDEKT